MENIIKQLFQIESKAIQIVEAAEDQKKEIACEIERKTKEFDIQLAKETKNRLQTMQEKQNEEKNAELKKLITDSTEFQNKLNQKFQQNHTKWANDLLKELIGA